MNFDQKIFLWKGLNTFFMIGMVCFVYWVLKEDVFILAIGWAAMFFLSEYFGTVRLMPFERNIGRLEGEAKALKRINQILKRARKTT